jgi:Tfp pilus assembly protein PilF
MNRTLTRLWQINQTIALKFDYAAAYFFRASLYQQRRDIEPVRADYTKANSLDLKLPDLNIKEK